MRDKVSVVVIRVRQNLYSFCELIKGWKVVSVSWFCVFDYRIIVGKHLGRLTRSGDLVPHSGRLSVKIWPL